MKKFSKVVSSLSLAAAMSLQCAAGVFAETTDGIISTDVHANVIPDYSISAPTDMTQSFVNEYDIDSLTSEQMEYYAKMPAETVTGISPIADGLPDVKFYEDCDLDFEKMEAEKQRVIAEARKENTDGIIAEIKDANYLTYDYTKDYYYKQLNSDNKQLYAELYDYCNYIMFKDYDITDYVSGCYIIPVCYIENTEDNVLSAYAFAESFLYSNPHFFFLGLFSFYKNDNGWYLALQLYDGYQDGTTRINAAKKINSIAGSWLSEINQGKDILEKESLLYKKMSNWITYGWEKNSDGSYKVNDYGYGIPDSSDNMSSQTIAGSLLKKTCVCAGYSRTFVYFCHLLGIEAIGITSDVHAWNFVKLYGTWYEIDVDAMDKIKEVDFVPNSSNTAYEQTYYDNIIDYTSCNVGEGVLLSGSSAYEYWECYPHFYDLPDISSSNGIPLYIYSRVDNAKNGQATLYWENMNKYNYVKYPMQYAFYTYLNGKYTCVGASNQITTNYGSYTFKNLKNGTKYGFLVRVKIWNPILKKYVWSGFTGNNIKYATIQSTAVSSPTITAISAGDGKVGLNWSAVSGATKYAVYTYLNGKYTCAVQTTSRAAYVNGLTNGTRYGFLVRAYVNGAWTTYNSSHIKYATPQGAAKPKITTIAASDGQVYIAWSAVANATEYIVYSYVGGSFHTLGTTTNRSSVITGLTNGYNYGFLVRAKVNGSWSAYTMDDVKYATPMANSSITFDDKDAAVMIF